MALGHALMAFASLFPQESRCDFQALAGRSERPSQYLRLADLYRRGDRTEAVRRLGDLDRLAVAEVLARLEKVRGNLEVLTPDDDCLHAASMMEAELGLALALDSRWQDADFHLDSAWKVSVEIQATGRKERFQRDFLLATGLFLHERIFLSVPEEAFARADTFLREAARRYPQDAEVLLATGALLEWSGSLPEGERSHLEEAAELYALCLQLVPEDREALLRQGWVHQKLGRNAEAEAALRNLLALGAGDILIYRARMILGRMAEGAGRLDEAVEHYRNATRILPSWQVAHLALAHVLHLSGAHDRARQVLSPALLLKLTGESFLGWWSYELGLARRFAPLLEKMRSEVRP